MQQIKILMSTIGTSTASLLPPHFLNNLILKQNYEDPKGRRNKLVFNCRGHVGITDPQNNYLIKRKGS